MATAMLFAGQGAQRVGMGRSLWEQSAAVRDLYAEADEVLGWPLSRYSFEGPEDTLTETRVCQPALFVHGMALFTLLQESGLTTDVQAACGLSLGELTALTAAGAFDYPTGLRVVAERGRLMQMACEASQGTMCSLIGGEIAQVKEICRQYDVEMANLNCPGQIVISGETAKVMAAAENAKAFGKFKLVTPLKVAGAYHSRLMEPARLQFAAFLAGVTIVAPRWTVFSNVTGKAVQAPADIRELLVRQVVSSVRWEECMRSAAALGITDFIECGPGGILAGLAKRTDRSWKVRSISEFAEIPGA